MTVYRVEFNIQVLNLGRGEDQKDPVSLSLNLKTTAADIAFIDRHFISGLYESSIATAAFGTLNRRIPARHRRATPLPL